MKKKILNRCGFGALVGLTAVMLIPTLINHAEDGSIRLVSEGLLALCGGATPAILMTLVLYGLYGALCFGGTLLYDIERWPLALATAAHYLLIAGGYALTSRLLRWDQPLPALLITEAIMTVGFFAIWLILYRRYKAEVRELNELNDREKAK
ncbi:MAG: DUF3021 domain-containing protein [Oscillospiraceae bacterium]|nr:DUF3021 domain-containing protein [Oscillospiraceae bacterium]